MEYNFDKVQDADFCCIHSLLDDVLGTYFTLNGYKEATIAIVAEGYLIEDLFKLLCSVKFGDGEEFQLSYVNFDNFDYDGEYLLTISYDYELCLEKLRTDDGAYLYTEAELIYIHEDCNYKVIERLTEGDENHILIFGLDGDCEE